MGFFKKEDVVLFSGFEGKLTKDGKPLAGAKITRTYELYEKQEDSTLTDENGYFSFPTITGKYSNKFMQQFVVRQKIYVESNNETQKIWFCGKLGRNEFFEFNGKPSNLTCELTDDIRRVDLEAGFVGTLCTWK